MAKINLLPWREELRAKRNQDFGVASFIAFVIGAVIVGGIMWYYGGLIDNQKSRNRFIEGQIAELDNQIKEIKDLKNKKERLLNRIKTIQELQTNRTEIVHLFDETVKAVPDGVYLQSMKQQGDKLTMAGVAESNTRVSEFIGNIEKSVWMTNPRIDVITRNKDTALQTNNFTLRAQQSSPNKKKSEEGDEG